MRIESPLFRRRRRALAAVLAGAALVGGCATTGTMGDGVDGAAAPGGQARWAGRFSAGWTDSTEPSRSDRTSGRFELATALGRTTLEVLSPFGQTVMRARAGADGASLETADGRRYAADTPEALTETVLGWRIPILRLPSWLGPGRPDRAVEDGWDIRIEARERDLPQRLSLRWPAEGAPAGGRSVTIRLIVDASDATPATPP